MGSALMRVMEKMNMMTKIMIKCEEMKNFLSK